MEAEKSVILYADAAKLNNLFTSKCTMNPLLQKYLIIYMSYEQ